MVDFLSVECECEPFAGKLPLMGPDGFSRSERRFALVGVYNIDVVHLAVVVDVVVGEVNLSVEF